MNFAYDEYKPSRKLSAYVDCYWKGTFNINAIESSSFEMMPNGCLEMIIHLDDVRCKLPYYDSWKETPEYMLIGLITRVSEVRFRDKVTVFTIRFKPEAIFTLFQLHGAEFQGKYEDSSLIMGEDFRDLCNRIRESKEVNEMISLTESYLLKTMQSRENENPYVSKAAHLLRNTDIALISEIADKVCISQRQLERKFTAVMGVSPKQYLRLTRINRVMRVMEQMQPLDLTSVAYHCGYFDQAHFIKDFKKITGQKPTIYQKERYRYIALPGQVKLD